MASMITVIATDDSERQLKGLSYRQQKAFKRKQQSITEQYPLLKELQRKEITEDGLEPDDMLKLREMEEELEEKVEPLMTEAIRMSLAKMDNEFAVPNLADGVTEEDIASAKEKAIEKIEDLFTLNQIKHLFQYSISGYIDAISLKEINGR